MMLTIPSMHCEGHWDAVVNKAVALISWSLWLHWELGTQWRQWKNNQRNKNPVKYLAIRGTVRKTGEGLGWNKREHKGLSSFMRWFQAALGNFRLGFKWMAMQRGRGWAFWKEINIGQDSRHKGAWGFPNLKEPAVVIMHMCGTGKGGRSGSRGFRMR